MEDYTEETSKDHIFCPMSVSIMVLSKQGNFTGEGNPPSFYHHRKRVLLTYLRFRHTVSILALRMWYHSIILSGNRIAPIMMTFLDSEVYVIILCIPLW